PTEPQFSSAKDDVTPFKVNGDASTLPDQRIPMATCESSVSITGAVRGADTEHLLRCKPMTATRYASITLSVRVVACGNSIFKRSETTPNILIGRCGEKSLLICIGFNIFQLLSAASPKKVVYVTMDWLPLKCMGLEYRVARNGVMG